MQQPLSHYYDWFALNKDVYPNLINEFKDNGASRFVLTDETLKNALTDPWEFTRFKRLGMVHNISFDNAHLPFGQPYDLCCAEKGRRQWMLEEQTRSMAYAAELGCRTCTVHIGAYESIYFKTPNDVLRPVVVDSLGVLVEEAEKLDIILAIENGNERTNTPDELLYYMSCFDSPHFGVCYDSGHACLMTDFPGKRRDKYIDYMDNVWGEVIGCHPDALGVLLPHIVTCHLHDNDGYSDSHKMPGEGRIEWNKLITTLCTAPRLVSMQSEVSMYRNKYSVRRLIETFDKLLQL